MNKYYLITFIGNENNKNNGSDITNDPNFSQPQPTWGICRPNVRRWKSLLGSTLIFLGYFKTENKYYIKGWFKVLESITYLEALSRFPDRENVIIRNSEVILNYNENWKSKKLKKINYNKYADSIPDFLKEIKFQGKKFVQNPTDDHEIDNWKCKRIFYCRDTQLEDCLTRGKCYKDSTFLKEKGYIVGEQDYIDVGEKWIPWEEIRPESFMKKELITPKKQHNVRSITASDFNEIEIKVNALIKSK